MPLGKGGLLIAPIYLKIRRRIALSGYGLPFLVSASGPHYIHLINSLALDEPLRAPITSVDQMLRR